MPTFVGFGGAASSSLLTASTPDIALPGYADDREEENEHGGDVNDEGEPSLGARINDHDQRGWTSGDLSDREVGDDNGIADEGGAQEQGYGFAI
jgi:hypothetical protein